jgi:UrcA family protein
VRRLGFCIAASYINLSTWASGENPAVEKLEEPQAIAEKYAVRHFARGAAAWSTPEKKGIAMKITALSFRAAAPRLAIIGLMLSGGAALAQQVEEITIIAPHEIHRKQIGKTTIGAPIEEISLTHRIGYNDLNLTTPDGLAALRQRVTDEAKLACDELDQLYPLDKDRDKNKKCVADATADAQAQINAAIQAMASKRK